MGRISKIKNKVKELEAELNKPATVETAVVEKYRMKCSANWKN